MENPKVKVIEVTPIDCEGTRYDAPDDCGLVRAARKHFPRDTTFSASADRMRVYSGDDPEKIYRMEPAFTGADFNKCLSGHNVQVLLIPMQ